jgi:hypothetical protein
MYGVYIFIPGSIMFDLELFLVLFLPNFRQSLVLVQKLLMGEKLRNRHYHKHVPWNYFTLKMVAATFSEESVTIYQYT